VRGGICTDDNLASARDKTMAIQKKIVLLPGDGIGPEIMQAAVRVLKECATEFGHQFNFAEFPFCLLYTSPSPRDLSTSRMPSSA